MSDLRRTAAGFEREGTNRADAVTPRYRCTLARALRHGDGDCDSGCADNKSLLVPVGPWLPAGGDHLLHQGGWYRNQSEQLAVPILRPSVADVGALCAVGD